MSVDRDYLETLTRRLDRLEKELLLVKNNQRPTVPNYDLLGGTATDSTPGSAPIDVIPGQIAVGEDDALHWVTKDLVWKTSGIPDISGDTYQLEVVTGVYNGPFVSIASAANHVFDIAYVRGTTVLDLTTAGNPTVTESGLHIVTANFQGDSAFSTGTALLAFLYMNGQTEVNSYEGAPTESATIGPNGSFGNSVFMDAGDNMHFSMTNRDSASRFAEWIEISVTRVRLLVV